MKKLRFYCSKCDKFLDRRAVTYDPWEDRYYCKWCKFPVVRIKRVFYAMLRDFIAYLKEKGGTDAYE